MNPKYLFFLVIPILATPLAAGRGPAEGGREAHPPAPEDQPGCCSMTEGSLTAAFPDQTVDPKRADSLRLLYEEERLAHEVYVELAGLFPGIRAFPRIAAAEMRHRAMIGDLAASLAVSLPEADKPGSYPYAELTDLHARLVSEGSVSPAAAARIGIEIEKRDIADLQAFRDEASQWPAAVAMANRLIEQSERHQAAFERLLHRGNGHGQGRP